MSRKLLQLWSRADEVASGGRKKAGGKKKKKGQAVKEKEMFEASLDKIFDILICTCPILSCEESSCSSSCFLKIHCNCKCPKDAKIPQLELQFIRDQRCKTGVRGKMQIGVRDAVETARQVKAAQREELEKKRKQEREETEAKKEEELFARHREQVEEQEKLLAEWEDSDPVVIAAADASSCNNNWVNKQNRGHFPRAMMAAMRGGVSQHTLANILSAYGVDTGLVTREDPSLLVDQAKVAREMEREMARVTKKAEEWMKSSGIDGIQFDGKEEKAWVPLEGGGKVR